MTWPADLRVVPVVTVPSLEVAVPLARALADGGLPVIEVTLRSPVALDAIEAIRNELPEVLCGVGTLLEVADVKAAVEVGAQFLVSPGVTDRLLDAMLDTGLLCLPGAATPSEAMRLRDRGVRLAKFFPAEASGGAAALSALAGPIPDLSWCATGGITAASAPDYLALGDVVAVGGAWMVPAAAVTSGDWARVTALASQAASL
jgi:2-dehydro-3-deoxyphosphogluconate aldolase/(4S)-4-hydroxy-2-oxoglutarate aldolase